MIAGDITRNKTRNEAADVIAFLEQYSTRMLDEIWFFGLGGSSPTPMKTAPEYTEEEIALTLRT